MMAYCVIQSILHTKKPFFVETTLYYKKNAFYVKLQKYLVEYFLPMFFINLYTTFKRKPQSFAIKVNISLIIKTFEIQI